MGTEQWSPSNKFSAVIETAIPNGVVWANTVAKNIVRKIKRAKESIWLIDLY
jgi:hypothetical protein